MGQGYFRAGPPYGGVNIELGAHVFALPAGARRNLTLEAPYQPAAVLDSGGGVLSLEVTGQRVRANLGDAERYIYETLRTLALSDPGDLGFVDGRGHQHVYGQSVCVSGSGEVQAFSFADMRFDFESPEKLAEPVWIGAPATPGTYPGTATLQDYAAGGVTLGIGGSMKLEMARSFPLREIPRARGARSRGPATGAQLRLLVNVGRVAWLENLATDLEDLIRSIGPRPVDLTANGNVYSSVIFERARPGVTDAKHTMVELEFVQDLAAGGVAQATTTTTTPT